MASMTIRNIDDQLKARLRVQAAQHGHSMEDEAREILRAALSTSAGIEQRSLAESIRSLAESIRSLAESIRSRIEPFGGVELDLPTREAIADRVNLGP